MSTKKIKLPSSNLSAKFDTEMLTVLYKMPKYRENNNPHLSHYQKWEW